MISINKAFSLIELMVVVAIIAILAAVSVPLYTSYMLNSKIGLAQDYLNSVTDQTWLFYDSQGGFGNWVGVASIGIPPQAGQADSSSLVGLPIAPYVDQVSVDTYAQGYAGPTSCAETQVAGSIDPSNPTPGGTNFEGPYEITYWVTSFEVNGVIQRDCYFEDSNQSTSLVINGCYNNAVPAQQTAEELWELGLANSC